MEPHPGPQRPPHGDLHLPGPGTQNDHHYHLEDEWWYIAEGELAWEMEGEPEPIHVKAGDFVFAPANHYHLIHVLARPRRSGSASATPARGTGTTGKTPPPPPVRGPATSDPARRGAPARRSAR